MGSSLLSRTHHKREVYPIERLFCLRLDLAEEQYQTKRTLRFLRYDGNWRDQERNHQGAEYPQRYSYIIYQDMESFVYSLPKWVLISLYLGNFILISTNLIKQKLYRYNQRLKLCLYDSCSE